MSKRTDELEKEIKDKVNNFKSIDFSEEEITNSYPVTKRYIELKARLDERKKAEEEFLKEIDKIKIKGFDLYDATESKAEFVEIKELKQKLNEEK